MSYFIAGLANSLASGIEERRRFVAEQAANTREYLEKVYSEKRNIAFRAREQLEQNAAFLRRRGFEDSEIMQILDRDPRELNNLSMTLQENEDLTVDDIRSVASFNKDYMPEVPLSEMIKKAAPIITKIDEPEPAARQQNIFQRLFSMDTSADRDRMLRDTNIGGFSGYDILGSVDSGPYRPASGERFIDYSGLPKTVSPAELKDATKNITESLLDYGLQIDSDVSITDDRLRQKFANAVEDRNVRAIQRMLFDKSNPAQYEVLSKYREQLLEEMTYYYEETPTVFNQPTFKDLGIRLSQYEKDLAETLTITGRPEDPEEVIKSIKEGNVRRVTIINPDTGESRTASGEDAIKWLRSTEQGQEAAEQAEKVTEVSTRKPANEYDVGSFTFREGKLFTVVEKADSGAQGRGRSRTRMPTTKEFEEVKNFKEVAATSISELDPMDYEQDSYVKVGNKIYQVKAETNRKVRNVPLSKRPRKFVEVGEL